MRPIGEMPPLCGQLDKVVRDGRTLESEQQGEEARAGGLESHSPAEADEHRPVPQVQRV